MNKVAYLQYLSYSAQGNTQRPEVCVVTWNSDELATDALPINGFEHYKENDFVANAPFLGNPRISW